MKAEVERKYKYKKKCLTNREKEFHVDSSGIDQWTSLVWDQIPSENMAGQPLLSIWQLRNPKSLETLKSIISLISRGWTNERKQKPGISMGYSANTTVII